MPKSTAILLDDDLAGFVSRRVAEGRYGSVEDVVRAGLRLLVESEAALETLRAALIEGETGGLPEPFDFDAFLAEKNRHAG